MNIAEALKKYNLVVTDFRLPEAINSPPCLEIALCTGTC